MPDQAPYFTPGKQFVSLIAAVLVCNKTGQWSNCAGDTINIDTALANNIYCILYAQTKTMAFYILEDDTAPEDWIIRVDILSIAEI